MRVLALFLIFLLHVAKLFDFEWWHIKNSELSLVLTMLVIFLSQWLLPLFFIISGASVYYTFGFRNQRQFIQDRFKRLIIPFIFGVFVLIPPQIYFQRLSDSTFSGTYLQFYPHYFDGLYGFGGNFAWMGLHLWYLLFLFIYSLIFLLLDMLLKKEIMSNIASGLITLLEKQGAIFLLALPLTALEMVLNPESLGRRGAGGWNIFAYIIFFIYGYLIFSNRKFQIQIRNYSILALFLGVFTTTVLLCLIQTPIGIFFTTYLAANTSNYGSLIDFLGMLLRGFNSWFWIIALLGLSNRFLNFNNRFLKYWSEAGLPFYILHQTVIVIIGFNVIQWEMNITAKYLIISIASFFLIGVVYNLVIKRWKTSRLLFGMKLKNG